MLRKKDAQSKASPTVNPQTNTHDTEMLQKILILVENANNSSQSSLTPVQQQPTGQGHATGSKTQSHSLDRQGQSNSVGQSQANTHGAQGHNQG